MRLLPLAVWVILLVDVRAGCGQQTQATGIVALRPAVGLYVETQEGFMVPYQVEIPTTKAVIEMLPIRGGELQIEVADGSFAVVEIEPFWMSKSEVTWHQYAAFMGLSNGFRKQAKLQATSLSRVDAVTAPTMLYEVGTRLEFATRSDCPAASMTQFAARQYSKWLSTIVRDQYRLPSEAEWTYACLAPQDGLAKLPTSRLKAVELDLIAVFGHDDGGPSPVGSKQPNAFGLHDMLGNVAEWVLDSSAAGSGFGQLEAGRYEVDECIQRAPTRFAALACGGSCWRPIEACQPDSRIVATEDLWMQDPDYPCSVSWLADFDLDRAIGFRIIRQLKELPQDEMQVYWLPDSEELEQAVGQRLGYRDVLGVPQPGPINWDDLDFPFDPPQE